MFNIRKIILVVFLVLLLIPAKAYGAEPNALSQQENLVDTDETQKILDSINLQNQGILPELNIKTIINNVIEGKGILSLKEIAGGILNYFTGDIKSSISTLIQIASLGVLCAIILNMESSFKDEAISKIAYFAIYTVLMILLIKIFKDTMNICTNTLDSMVDFMQSLMPTLFAAMVSSGSYVSAASFKPLIAFALEITGLVYRNFIVPFIFWTAILSLISNLNSNIHINRFVSLLKQVATFLLVVMPVIFLGIVTMEGIASPFVDNAAIRTAKFAAGKFIPYVGSVLSDTVDTILNYGVIIKNCIGIVGMIAVLFIIICPIIKILVIYLILRLSAAFLQPLTDERITKSVDDVASSVSLLMCCIIVIATMLFIMLAILLASTSIGRG